MNPRSIPEWLAPHKNEWRSMSTMANLFSTEGRPLSVWLQEIRPRLRCVQRPMPSNRGVASYYLVKQVWACSLAHGVKLIPSASLNPDADRIAELEAALAEASTKLYFLSNRTPEFRIAPAARIEPGLLAAMLSATEPRPLPGVYFLISEGQVTYVGQSQNVLARMSGHARKSFDTVKMIHIPDPPTRLIEESRWIMAFEPRDNVKGLESRRTSA